MTKPAFRLALGAILMSAILASPAPASAKELGLVIGSSWQPLNMDVVVRIDPSFLYVGSQTLAEAHAVRQYWFWKKKDRVAFTSVWAATGKTARLNAPAALAGSPAESAVWTETNKAGTYKGLDERLAGMFRKQGLPHVSGCFIVHFEFDIPEEGTTYVTAGLRRPIGCDYAGWESIHSEFKDIFTFSHRRHHTP